MKKDDLYPTNKSINIYYNKGKNPFTRKLDHNFNTLFVPKKYPISRNYSKLYNSNRKYEIDNLYFNSLLRDYDNYFKNQSIQSDLEDEIENRNNKNRKKQNLINFILNKKLKTYRAKRLKEISMNSSNILDSLYGKGMFEKKFERNYMMRSKPLKYYFENKNKTPKSIDKRSNILSFFDKDEYLSHNKNIFETIELGDKKEIFAIKLLNDDNDKNKDNNLDCHSLMKYPSKSYNISTYNNYSKKFSNFFPSLRSKLKAINFKSEDNKKPNFHDLKLLSRKGFDNMKKNRKYGISKQIYDTLEEIESNRKKFDLILSNNLKIFNKNKEEMLKIKI